MTSLDVSADPRIRAIIELLPSIAASSVTTGDCAICTDSFEEIAAQAPEQLLTRVPLCGHIFCKNECVVIVYPRRLLADTHLD